MLFSKFQVILFSKFQFILYPNLQVILFSKLQVILFSKLHVILFFKLHAILFSKLHVIVCSQPLVQSIARAAAAAASSPHTPPHPAHTPQTPHTPNYSEKLEEALLHPPPILRRINLPPRRMSRSADNSPDVIKRARHDNNNDQPQIHDFSTKNHSMINNTRAHEQGNNGNGISNSSSSPSPRLIDEVKNEPLELMCQSNPDIDRSTDDTPPHSHHRPLVSIKYL